MSLLRPTKGDASFSRLKPFLESFHRGFGRNESRAHLCVVAGLVDVSKWRKLDSRKLGIKSSLLSASSWIVLQRLQTAGFEAYLVGGCVRDFLLNKVPKDFDVITTARLVQVKKEFQRAIIVGTKFPICRVTVKGSVVEVSSFETATAQSRNKQVSISKIPTGCDLKDFTRWKDCMHRDFTINSLFYDPFANTIFDYTDAMADLRSLKLKTVIPAHLSFKQDQARILRGLRLAARLNLSFSKETEAAIDRFSSSVTVLSKSRISLEMNYMMSYGAAEPSLLLLKRFKLLELFLPFNAAYLSQQAERGHGLRSSMLMKLFFNLDQLITCDRPCDDCLWVALLVFHTALFNNPQKAVVVLTIASIFYHGTWEGSIKFAREHASSARTYVPEILNDFDFLSDDEVSQKVTKFFSQVKDSLNIFISMDCLSKAIARFPEYSCSGFVLVSHRMGLRVKDVFSILMKDVKSSKAKKGLDVECRWPKAANKRHIRFELGKILVNTLVCGATNIVTGVKKDDIQITDPPPKVEVLQQMRHTTVQVRTINDKNTKSMSQSNDKLSPKSKARLSGDSFVVTDARRKMIAPRQPNVVLDNNRDACQLLENVDSSSGEHKAAVTMQSSEKPCKILKEWHDEVKKRQHMPKEEPQSRDVNMQSETAECDSCDSHNHNRSLNEIGKDKHVKAEAPRIALSRLFK